MDQQINIVPLFRKMSIRIVSALILFIIFYVPSLLLFSSINLTNFLSALHCNFSFDSCLVNGGQLSSMTTMLMYGPSAVAFAILLGIALPKYTFLSSLQRAKLSRKIVLAFLALQVIPFIFSLLFVGFL